MADQDTDAGAKLQKLGQRLKAGFAKKHPAQNLETVRSAVHKQFVLEQETKREKPATPSAPAKDKQPEEPDHGH